MEWKAIDRLRDPGFAVVRRGYDQREVDKLLDWLVDWLETDAAGELGELAVKRKLEHVGKSASRILLATEQESEQLRRTTREECAELRAEAEAASSKTRQSADEYASKVRAKADDDARRAHETARAAAAQNVEEGQQRRAQIDAVIGELEAHRDRTIQDLERLRAELGSAIATHKPGASAPKRNAKKPPAPGDTAVEADAVTGT